MSGETSVDELHKQQMVEATQRAAGVIAARDRGDRAGAARLLGEFGSETERMMAFYMCAELALRRLATTTGETIAEAASSLSVDIDGAAG